MQLSLYNSIDDKLLEKVGFKIGDKTLEYEKNEDSEKELIEIPTEVSELIINEYDSSWSPIENNLIIKQKFSFEDPSNFFGIDGVANEHNSLGLACHIYSKTSNFQKTVHLGTINYSEKKLEITFEYEFEPNSIGGVVYFDFFIYLNEVQVPDSVHSSIKGTNLSSFSVDNFYLIVDGTGSEFPIQEIDDKTQPLWRLDMNWTDIFEDTFDANSIRIILNRGHVLFTQLMNQKYKINQYFMNDIIITSMAMLIQKVVLIEMIELNEDIEYGPGTIAQVIWYWISTFEINLESLESISNSLRKKADHFIEEAD